MYGFFFHFSENSKTTRKLFQASIKVNRTIIFLKFQTVITSLMQIFIFETRVLSTKTQNNLYITRIYPLKELYRSCLSDFFILWTTIIWDTWNFIIFLIEPPKTPYYIIYRTSKRNYIIYFLKSTVIAIRLIAILGMRNFKHPSRNT